MATFFSGGSFADQNKDPVLNFSRDNPGKRDISGSVVGDYTSGKISQEEALAKLNGTPDYKPELGPVVGGTPTGAAGVTPNAGLGTGFTAGGNSYGSADPFQEQKNAVRDYLGSTPTQPSGVETRGTSQSSTGTSAPTSLEDLIKTLGAPPAAPDLSARESALSTQYGADALDSQLSTVNQQISDLNTKSVGAAADINGTPTSSGFRGRALGQLGKDEKVQLAQLQGQQKSLTSQLNNAHKAISTAMGLEKTDYANARAAYNSAFSENMRILSANNSQGNHEQTQALANFKYLMDTYAKHNLNYNDLSPEEKQGLETMAHQSGNGPELLAFMQSKPKNTITDKTTNNGVTTITSKDQNGNTKVTHIVNNKSAAVKPYTSGGLSIPRADIAEGQQKLESSRGKDGFADTKMYTNMMQHWIQSGGLEQDFLKQYPPKNYLNPSDSTIPSTLKK